MALGPRHLKALLVNDASLLGHHGSAIVTEQIVRHAAAADIDLAHGWTWEAALDALAKNDHPFDVVIVNGEGSVHSDSRAAKRVAQLAGETARRSTAAYLVNATVEGNSLELTRELARFRLCFVRDTPSQANLAQAGVKANVVHDLTLTASHLANVVHYPSGPLLVTDASDQDTTRRLMDLAQKWNAQPITLRARPPRPERGSPARSVKFEIKRQISRLAPHSGWSLRYRDALTRETFLSRLSASSGIVSGRYHAVCLALRTGSPFLAIAGNTGKTGALLSDIGIADRALSLRELEFLRDPPAIPIFSDAERGRIAAFLSTTEGKARDMFAAIAADARGHLA
jgi:hypothetical protein